MSAPANYHIESVENAARVLLMLREQRALRVADVAAELGIARSSAHRLITTLQAQGLLRQEPAKRTYGPGPLLIQIGVAVIGASDLKSELRPTIETVSKATGETVHLMVLDDTRVVFLDGAEGRYAIRAAVRAGDREPAHATAAGKVLLASLSREGLRTLYPGSRLKGGTSRAIASRRALESELDTVRQDGYATSLGESESGLHAIAVPVRDAAETVRAAITVSGPAQRLTEEALIAHLPALFEATDRSGRLLS